MEWVVTGKRVIVGVDGKRYSLGDWRLTDFIRRSEFHGYYDVFSSASRRVSEYVRSGVNPYLGYALMYHAVWDEVVERIRYRSDATVFPRGEFWQFPEETLSQGLGDCEDTTFLFVSVMEVLSKQVYDSLEVYAALGWFITSDGDVLGHAFPVMRSNIVAGGKWVIPETTFEKPMSPTKWIMFDYRRYFPVILTDGVNVWRIDDEDAQFMLGVPKEYVEEKSFLVRIMSDYVFGGKVTEQSWMHKDKRVPEVSDLVIDVE